MPIKQQEGANCPFPQNGKRLLRIKRLRHSPNSKRNEEVPLPLLCFWLGRLQQWGKQEPHQSPADRIKNITKNKSDIRVFKNKRKNCKPCCSDNGTDVSKNHSVSVAYFLYKNRTESINKNFRKKGYGYKHGKLCK